MSKIRIGIGGSVDPGETFEWENESDSDCTITGTGAFLTQSSYSVKAKKTTSATVKSDAEEGDYAYSAQNGTKRQNPTIHVNSTV